MKTLSKQRDQSGPCLNLSLLLSGYSMCQSCATTCCSAMVCSEPPNRGGAWGQRCKRPSWDVHLKLQHSRSAFLSGFRAPHPMCSHGRRDAVWQRKELQKLGLSGRQGLSWPSTSSTRFVTSVRGGSAIFSCTVLLSSSMVVQSAIGQKNKASY